MHINSNRAYILICKTILYICTFLQVLMWVFFVLKCAKLSIFCILQIFAATMLSLNCLFFFLFLFFLIINNNSYPCSGVQGHWFWQYYGAWPWTQCGRWYNYMNAFQVLVLIDTLTSVDMPLGQNSDLGLCFPSNLLSRLGVT